MPLPKAANVASPLNSPKTVPSHPNFASFARFAVNSPQTRPDARLSRRASGLQVRNQDVKLDRDGC